jgi:hypothetical protein
MKVQETIDPHSADERMQVNQTSCFELVMNQRVTVRLGSVIYKRFVEFLSFGFTAGTSLRLQRNSVGASFRGRPSSPNAYIATGGAAHGGTPLQSCHIRSYRAA